MSDFEGSSMDSQPNPIVKTAIIWGLVAIALSILLLTKNSSAMVLGASTWAKVGAFALSVPMGLAGALIGDAIRKFAAPDMIFTSGGMGSLFWQKVFWAIGPQSIGCVIGSVLGSAIVLG